MVIMHISNAVKLEREREREREREEICARLIKSNLNNEGIKYLSRQFQTFPAAGYERKTLFVLNKIEIET
jgi:hypothetical protein